MKFNIFDILYLKKQNLKSEKTQDIHNLPFSHRRKILEKILDNNHTFSVIDLTITSEAEVCRKLHQKYLNQGLEGVIIKKWDSPYTPGRKGWHWVKMKEVETAHAGLADTLDCVVMGYYRGRGQRTKLGLGAFLVGIVGAIPRGRPTRKTISSSQVGQAQGTAHTILTVSKIGTGLTEDQFRDLAKRLKPLETKDKPTTYEVSKDLQPDVWVEPSLIVEIAADNITKSKNHTSEYGLRFPRLVKFRDDKSPDQASTLEEVISLFKMQK